MAGEPTRALDRRPEARAETVEDLVRLAREGRVRVPEFQRGLNWSSTQVLDLFDSVYRGFPIGSLLLFRRRAEAASVRLGPLAVDAPEVPDAWWVVDGQQRLTALAASMARRHPLPSHPSDPYIVYFDPDRHSFHAPPKHGDVPPFGYQRRCCWMRRVCLNGSTTGLRERTPGVEEQCSKPASGFVNIACRCTCWTQTTRVFSVRSSSGSIARVSA